MNKHDASKQQVRAKKRIVFGKWFFRSYLPEIGRRSFGCVDDV